MSVRDIIQEDLKTAMKAGDKERVSLIRFILAAVKQREVDEQKTLSEDEFMMVLDKQAKQRRDSIEQYEAGGRNDLADKERQELTILQHYLPEPLSDAELEQLITDALTGSGATEMKEMGKVMAILKPQVQGRTDMKQLSGKIRAKLTG